jgi:hypothetical protein
MSARICEHDRSRGLEYDGVMRGLSLILLAGCGRFGFDAGDPPSDPDAPVGTGVRITIEHNGGDGTVVGPNGFTCTTGTCTFDVAPGTEVSLRGLAATDAWFAGWSGPCGGNFKCDLYVDADVTIVADFTPTPNRVFVTSTTTDGAFGGIAGADAICAARAAAADLTGTFIAYLSDNATTAASRVVGSRGWIRTDGAPFVDAPTAFSTGAVWFPSRLDELGNDLGSIPAYTGTSFGAATANRCLEWTSNAGAENGTTNELFFGYDSFRSSNRACSSQQHLLCTEIGRVVPITVRPDTGRLAFMSTAGWKPGGGRASADAHCANEATAAGLPGTFLAAIATTTESIASRFPEGKLYRRVDGVRLLRSSDLFTAEWVDVPPELDGFGDVVSNDFWTGAQRFDATPLAAENCNDWTDGTTALAGVLHWTTNTEFQTPAKTEPCNQTFPVLCVEN